MCVTSKKKYPSKIDTLPETNIAGWKTHHFCHRRYIFSHGGCPMLAMLVQAIPKCCCFQRLRLELQGTSIPSLAPPGDGWFFSNNKKTGKEDWNEMRISYIILFCIYECFRKWWYPQIIHFDRVFHYKPSNLGYPYFWKHPYELSVVHIYIYSISYCCYVQNTHFGC